MSEPTIRVVCCADHPVPTAVATMVRDSAGRWRDWGGRTSGREVDLVLDGESATTELVGDSPAPVMTGEPEHEASRLVHVLRCRRCGRTVTMRGERLDPLLDRAVEAKVAEVPLRVLDI